MLGLIGLLLLVGAVVAVEVYGTPWSPAAAPERIRFESREYTRGDEQPGGLPVGYVLKGETPGGGQIYKFAKNQGTSVIVYVKDGTLVYIYGLVGGP